MFTKLSQAIAITAVLYLIVGMSKPVTVPSALEATPPVQTSKAELNVLPQKIIETMDFR